MRLMTLAVLGGLVAASAAATAAPPMPASPPVDRDVHAVQDRLLPRFFGGGDDGEGRDRAEMALRIEQLEQQVRMLTGQVETLAFTVRRLERALEADGRLPPRGDAAPPATGAVAPPTTTARIPPSDGGPLDLSALNRGLSEVSPSSPVRATPEPVSTPALRNARQLLSSGRYAMAAQEARQVLLDNPSGPVAGEARFLLGEVLLAQGSYRNAANLFLENYTNDPGGARAPASLLKLSSALNGLGEREAACSSLEEFFGAYPNIDAELRAEAEREQQAANCT